MEISGQDLGQLTMMAERIRAYFRQRDDMYAEIEDTLPLPGIEWNLAVDREAAGRFKPTSPRSAMSYSLSPTAFWSAITAR